mmetsp:Transcript_8052/g.29891  ORF Transcript_8052/g.29891 Transcript_8052/m.29891 type:complete len:292 (-) Transcript_8052:633-1508(-)
MNQRVEVVSNLLFSLLLGHHVRCRTTHLVWIPSTMWHHVLWWVSHCRSHWVWELSIHHVRWSTHHVVWYSTLLTSKLLHLSLASNLWLVQSNIERLVVEHVSVHLGHCLGCILWASEAHESESARYLLLGITHYSHGANLTIRLEQLLQFGLVDFIGQVAHVQVGVLLLGLVLRLNSALLLEELCSLLLGLSTAHKEGLGLVFLVTSFTSAEFLNRLVCSLVVKEVYESETAGVSILIGHYSSILNISKLREQNLEFVVVVLLWKVLYIHIGEGVVESLSWTLRLLLVVGY